MDLVIIPFHDLRKCQKEGFRTRDCHLMEHFFRHQCIDKTVIINRPITYIESIYKKKSWKTAGKEIKKGPRYRITEVSKNCFVLDFLSFDIIGNILKGKSWFFDAYGRKSFVLFVHNSLRELGFSNYYCLNFTVLSINLISQLHPVGILFDAWDNWLRIESYKSMYHELYESYKKLSDIADIWTTNSDQNKIFFSNEFKIKDCHVIKNGVDIDKFNKPYPIPDDLKRIKKPIIGIAAKITHLIDVDLLNEVVDNTENCSFVLIGQILDRHIFNRLSKKIIYLGDKHYSDYPMYVKSFDICFIPYVVGEKEHGGDSIKVYEFIAAGKPVIATNFGGINTFKETVIIIKNSKEFDFAIKKISQMKNYSVPEWISRNTWGYRTDRFITLLKDHMP